MTTHKLRGVTMCALLASTALVCPTAALGQFVPPDAAEMDRNGVNLLNLDYAYANQDISIGEAKSALSFVRFYRGGTNYAQDNWTYYLRGSPSSTSATTVYVVAAGTSDSFQCTNNVCQMSKNGTQLVLESADGDGNYTWNYIMRDGTKILFDNFIRNYVLGNFHNATALARSVTNPDGTKFDIGWQSAQYFAVNRYLTLFRKSAVTSNRGYKLNFAYFRDSGLTAANYSDYTQFQSVTAINDAVNPASQTWPSVQYTRITPGATTSVTNSLGKVTQFSYDANGNLTGILRPGHTNPDIAISYVTNTSGQQYVPYYQVSQFTTAGQTWNYSYSVGSTTATATVTDPLSKQRTMTTASLPPNRVGSITNELGRTTSFTYDTDRRLTRVTAPEGNYVQYAYDSRGNATQTTQVAKSGSGLANIVTSATYDATCTSAIKCNKPNTTTDARGNVTDYTYDTTHGGLLTVTLPAPTSGAVRPQTRYSYAPLYAWTYAGVQKDTPVYRLTGTSACQTTASCSATADEVKTTITYQAGSSSVGSNITPVTTTAGNGTGALTASSAVTYDAIGNLTTVDGPLSGTADTKRIRYDAGRQAIGLIAPDPDGAGSRKHGAQRISYTDDGQISVTEIGTVNSQSDADWALFAPSQAVTSSYDGYGRKTKDVLSSGGTSYGVTQYSYDELSRPRCTAARMNSANWTSLPTSACDQSTPVGSHGADRIVRTTYDEGSQVTKVQTAYGTADQADEVQYTYTNNGLRASASDGEGNPSVYQYDGHDRLGIVYFPTANHTGVNWTDYISYTFDANSNVTNVRLRDGQNIANSYDNLNRVTANDLPNTVYGEYDRTYTYDNLGRPLTIGASSGHDVTFGYDALGRKISEQNYIGTKTYLYDLAGRRTRLTWPDAFYVTYDYDVTGNVTAIRENGATSGAGVLATYAYDNLGRRTTVTRGNGTVASYGYDAVSRLSSLGENMSGTTHDVTLGFTYSPGSQIATNTRSNDLYAWGGHYNRDKTETPNGLKSADRTGQHLAQLRRARQRQRNRRRLVHLYCGECADLFEQSLPADGFAQPAGADL